jgi:hypothetical protein
MLDLGQLFSLILSHSWIALAALVVGAIVAVLKGTTPLPAISPKYRPWLALGLGVVAGILKSISTGTPAAQAILSGLGSGMIAITGHETLIESVRGGKELIRSRA